MRYAPAPVPPCSRRTTRSVSGSDARSLSWACVAASLCHSPCRFLCSEAKQATQSTGRPPLPPAARCAASARCSSA
eukprot:5675171-Karenia_brevis.AAC.1